MHRSFVEPPAIVKQAGILAELAPKIRATYRRVEEDRRQLGLWLLQCKEACLLEGIPWLEWLERETDIPHDTATRLMNAVDERRQESSTITQLRNSGQCEEEELAGGDTPSASPSDAWWAKDSESEPDEGELTQEERERRANAHVSQNTGNPEWYTPATCIDAARKVLGDIDLDPATSEIAQRTVQASTYYTADDDGLAKDWQGRVWMNPPYSADLVTQFVGKLCDHIEAGDVSSAIVLVNNATETRWLQRGLSMVSAVCFPAGRIKFLDEEGNPGAPLQGQVFLYFGDETPSFAEVFKVFGAVLVRNG